MLSPRRNPTAIGPDVGAMPPPAPLQFAAPPSMPPPDATGAQAIGNLAGLATALQSKLANRGGGGGGGPVDAPMRRKSPFADAAAVSANFA